MTVPPLIRIEGVSKWYHAGTAHEVRALDHISMEIEDNRFIVLAGPSGSGKTTLLGLMGTVDRPTSGRIYLQGQDIGSFSDLELSRIRRKAIGLVFQSFHLFSGMTAWENVAYPLIPTGMPAKERLGRANDLLARLGLDDRIHHTPEQLSGGQQQRVAIARALVNDPQIIMADEPTSSIDQDAVVTLLNILEELKSEGRTVVVASHDPVFKDHADVVFRLNRGRLETVEARETPSGARE